MTLALEAAAAPGLRGSEGTAQCHLPAKHPTTSHPHGAPLLDACVFCVTEQVAGAECNWLNQA